MIVHLLVEGQSERSFLDLWAPRVILNASIKIHHHQGKGKLPINLGARPDDRRRGLLDQLPAKLRGFAHAEDANDHRVVVLVDADDDDPAQLSAEIVNVAKEVAADLSVVVAVATEETEAFYLGDLGAMKAAYPNADMVRAKNYLPDSIVGTWELFGEIIGDAGGNKVAWAERMGARLTTKKSENRSPSFKRLVDELVALEPSRVTKKKRAFRHTPRRKGPSGRR